MPLRISFNLRDADLQHFGEVAQRTQASAREVPADAVIAAAREVLDTAERAQVAEFVKERFSRLRAMLSMVLDEEWPLGAQDRQRIVNALACFGGVPESAGGAKAGFLDHAIMIELVSRDLEHDLSAYHDFCKYRDSLAQRRGRAKEIAVEHREELLQQRRELLQARMHKRRKRAMDAAGSSVRKLFSLFGL